MSASPNGANAIVSWKGGPQLTYPIPPYMSDEDIVMIYSYFTGHSFNLFESTYSKPRRSDGNIVIELESRVGNHLFRNKEFPSDALNSIYPDLKVYTRLPVVFEVPNWGLSRSERVGVSNVYRIVRILAKREDGLVVKIPKGAQLNSGSGPTKPTRYWLLAHQAGVHPFSDSNNNYHYEAHLIFVNPMEKPTEITTPSSWKIGTVTRVPTCVVCKRRPSTEVWECPAFHLCTCLTCCLSTSKCPVCLSSPSVSAQAAPISFMDPLFPSENIVDAPVEVEVEAEQKKKEEGSIGMVKGEVKIDHVKAMKENDDDDEMPVMQEVD